MNEVNVSSFITCNKRINKPSIHVKVCMNKCEFKDECPDFLAYSQISFFPDVSKELTGKEKTA